MTEENTKKSGKMRSTVMMLMTKHRRTRVSSTRKRIRSKQYISDSNLTISHTKTDIKDTSKQRRPRSKKITRGSFIPVHLDIEVSV